MHAVIVDANPVDLRQIAEQFFDRGDSASVFTDSREALARISNDQSVNILITSLNVLPFGGLELCWEARLRATKRRPLYISVMTSDRDGSNVEEALDCGADDLMFKPIGRQQLYARLRMVLRLQSAQLELVRLAETDALTGVHNRGAFFEQAELLMRERQLGTPLSAVMLDIDHFKKINDTHGHQIGDKVIRAVASEAAGTGGITGRLGGEEFAILLPDRTEAQAFAAASALLHRCASLVFESNGHEFQITCSLGVATWMEGDTPDTILHRADVALYQAKTGGRNQVQISSSTGSLVSKRARSIVRRH
jgi:two-component system cell cycle response regulator